MSDKELKKLKSKQRRAQKKQQIEEEKKGWLLVVTVMIENNEHVYNFFVFLFTDHKEGKDVETKKNDDGKPDPLVLVKVEFIISLK